MAEKRNTLLIVPIGLMTVFAACVNQAKLGNLPEPGPVPPISQSGEVEMFALGDVILLDGPFKTSLELNNETLLKYDADRLLAPFFVEAGLIPKQPLYSNWSHLQNNFPLEGHLGGHYLSALAMAWAVTRDTRMYERMEYMLDGFELCQNENGNGYLSGVYNGKALWNNIKNGNVSIPWPDYAVPWYNIHKTYAGLRDSWIYANSQRGKEMFLRLCDWGLGVIENLSDGQMESMLGTEFGGMNEVYADAYKMTDDSRYLAAAKRFSHKVIFDAMAEGNDNLNDRHANTQVPKAVGYAKIAKYTGEQNFINAANFFWDRVVNYRSFAFGGNSTNEYFRAPSVAMLNATQGAETCNTYNMLKLSETLFCIDSQVKYADFYEKALYNHILSSQNPQTGGYVYFTQLRPEHYRVYSAATANANGDMWCCVGTGMENHAKHGAFIYARTGNTLYVNLFIASTVSLPGGRMLTQTTNFPDEETSTLTVSGRESAFKLRIRYPSWVRPGQMSAIVEGEDYAAGVSPGTYIEIDRTWSDRDTVHITMPMNFSLVRGLTGFTDYVAIMRGPVLYGMATATEAGLRMYGNGTRMGHAANGSPRDSVITIPGNEAQILAKLEASQDMGNSGPVPGSLSVDGLLNIGSATLIPFFRLHNSRYMMYWNAPDL